MAELFTFPEPVDLFEVDTELVEDLTNYSDQSFSHVHYFADGTSTG